MQSRHWPIRREIVKQTRTLRRIIKQTRADWRDIKQTRSERRDIKETRTFRRDIKQTSSETGTMPVDKQQRLFSMHTVIINLHNT